MLEPGRTDSLYSISAIEWQMRQPESPVSRVILDLLFLNLDNVRRWKPSEEPGLCSVPVQAWARAALQGFQRARGRNGAWCTFERLGAALHG